ncbi:hypothetical protein [Amycolatopsis suaedae]|uniref:Uncharacterized protein n=1 Tax=Amycolatopsis suaedae TaxID=2510978 RepID=A0A4Q7J1X8_9PSEU|nr:hypothetical protein [Amycolatopsis suaedae]RZQ60869.1 hypothetical protein EWH70_27610 [Amycolatopsis suaedae]
MFLAPPDLAATDAVACLGVRAPAVLTDDHGNVCVVGVTRPAVALDMIRAAAPAGVPVPGRADALTFRLRWFTHGHPAGPGDPAVRPARPGERGAFPAVLWRHADQVAARTRVAAVAAAA